jgi:ADP-ribosylglycohydrolase
MVTPDHGAGVLLGLACGDAVGRPVEGYPADRIAAEFGQPAVNLGGDTDTVGAMAGAIGGARFGAGSLPDRWLADLDRRAELRDLGERLASGTFTA